MILLSLKHDKKNYIAAICYQPFLIWMPTIDFLIFFSEALHDKFQFFDTSYHLRGIPQQALF